MSRVVLITGCSTGIGRTVMERLTVSGHLVMATVRRAGSLKGVAASSGLVLDVIDSAATDFAVAAIPRRHGRIDVLLNDAGCAGRGVVEEVPGAAVPARSTSTSSASRGWSARSLLSATTRRATLSDGKSDHLGLSRRSARAPRGEPVRVMRVNRLACWQTDGGVEDDRFSRSGRRGSSAR